MREANQGLKMAIEEHHQVEDEPGKSEAWQRLLTEQLPALVWTTDRDLKFTSSTGRGLKALGLEPNEVVQSALDLYAYFQTDSKAFPPIEAHLRSLLGESTVYETEWQGRHFHSQTNPLKDRDGNITGVIGVALDISERKHFEAALRRAHDELESRVRERTAELEKINEELRTEIATRKLAEALLRDSEEKYRSVVTAMTEGIILQRADGVIMTCNPSAERILGLRAGEILGSTFINLAWHTIHEDGSPFPGDAHPAEETLQTGNPGRNVIMGIHRPDGVLVWLSINSEPLVLPGECRPYAVVTSFADITERRKIEAAQKKVQEDLKASEERFRSIFDSARDGILVTDPLTKLFQLGNPAICDMLGYSPEEIRKLGAPDIYPEQELSYVAEQFERDLKGEISLYRDLPMKRKDGSIFYADLSTFLLTLDEKVLLAGVFRDITERRQAKKAQEESEQKFRAIFEQAAVGVAVVESKSGKFLKINRKYADIIGYSPEETQALDFMAISHPDDLQADLDKMQLLLDRKIHSFSMEKRLYRKDRSVIWVNLTVSPMLGSDDGLSHHIAIVEDITQGKLAVEQTVELLQQNRELVQHLFSLQENERRHLARELHDEVGQWLTAIQLYAQAIVEKTRTTQPGISADAGVIIKSAQRVTQHVRSIMHSLRPAELDEAGLVDGLRQLVKRWRIQYPDIECRLSIDGELDNLDDRINITVFRIVQESLTNVARHAGADCVAVELQRRGPGEASPGMVLLAIEDNGKGLDYTAASKGLGLPGIRERVLAVRGELALSRPKQGKGLCLGVKIPVDS